MKKLQPWLRALLLWVLLPWALLPWGALHVAGDVPAEAEDLPPAAIIKVPLEGFADAVHILEGPDGRLLYRLRRHDGRTLDLSPEDFARKVFDEETHRAWWLNLLNITSPFGLVWVTLGLAGQLLFSARMVLQWLASERERRSVVPPSFWWISLIGATMLIVYFVWRKDIVGILGQSTGWIIYLRNLRLIYREARSVAVPE